MKRPVQSEKSTESRLDIAIGDFMRRVDRGTPVDRESFISEYADVENELRTYFGTVDRVEQVAGRQATRAIDEENKPASDTASVLQREQETLSAAAHVASHSERDKASETAENQFGRYRIVKTLGQGGMGIVHLAEDPQLDRLVAIKVPFFGEDDQGSILSRFRREVKAVAAIQHPNICPIYDVGDMDGVPFMAMAYIEGKPLSELIRPDKPLRIRAVSMLVRKLALAVEQAHKAGVIHRDLKPANVMINKLREPVIMDFGLARCEGKANGTLTRTGDLMGTPHYMPPEQVSGDVEAMGPGCDIYSLGVMLYELLTGRCPFSGDTLAVLSQIALEEPTKPSTHRPEIDEQLDRICLKAMSKKIEDRFRSMGEFAQHLTAYIKSHGAEKTAEAGETVRGSGEIDELLREPRTAEHRPQAEPSSPLPKPRQGAHARSEPTPPPVEPASQRHTGLRPLWATPPWRWAAVAGGLVALLLVACGVIVLLSTEYGTVKIEIDDPNATVLIDGNETTIEGLGDPIRLRVGAHTLLVKRGDIEVEAREFQIVKGQNTPLRITLTENADPLAAGARTSPGDVPPKTPTPPPDERNTDWRTIFNGRDLSGWSVLEPNVDLDNVAEATLEDVKLLKMADMDGWKPQDGVLICEGVEQRVLVYDEVLDDFEVSMEIRLPPEPYRGLFQVVFRVNLSEGTQGQPLGFLQTRLHDERECNRLSPTWKSGGLHAVVAPTTNALRPQGEWNVLQIRCDGDRLQITLNGIQTVNTNLKETLPPEFLDHLSIESGLFGFYGYGSSKDVQIRNIRLRKLTPGSADSGGEEDSTSLFNGRDLSGWNIIQDGSIVDTGWEVQNDTIVCTSGVEGVLVAERLYGDFVLQLDVKIPAGGAPTVVVRGADDGGIAIPIVKDDDDMRSVMSKNPGLSGKATAVLIKIMDAVRSSESWNEVEFACSGKTAILKINDKAVFDGALSELGVGNIRNAPDVGLLGLLNFEGRAKGTAFRNIRIRELGSAEN